MELRTEVTNKCETNLLVAILVWLVASLFVVLQYFHQQSIGVITLNLRKELNLTAFELSLLSSSYFCIYLLLQVPAGILIDRYGVRRLLAIGSLIATIGTYLFANAGSIWVAIISRMMIGGGVSFGFISSVNIGRNWLPAKLIPLSLGATESLAMLGALGGNMFVATQVDTLGWRGCINQVFYCSLLLGVLAWIIIRDCPKNTEKPNYARISFSQIRRILTNTQMLLNGLYIGLMYTSITVFSALWGNPFLQIAHGLSIEESTFACSLVFVGTGIFSPLIGWFCSNCKKQLALIKLSSLVLMGILLLIIYLPNLSIPVIYLLTFCLGASCSSIILCFTIASKLAPQGGINTSIGVLNALSLLTAPVAQSVIGFILNIASDEVSKYGLELYYAHHYRIALSVLPTLVLVAFFSAFKIKH